MSAREGDADWQRLVDGGYRDEQCEEKGTTVRSLCSWVLCVALSRMLWRREEKAGRTGIEDVTNEAGSFLSEAGPGQC